jgi:hypothetical protein
MALETESGSYPKWMKKDVLIASVFAVGRCRCRTQDSMYKIFYGINIDSFQSVR